MSIPNFPIVDTHVHLWDPQQFRMPWLDENPTLRKPFGLADYKAHTNDVGVNIGAFVYVEVAVAPAYGLLEARWVADRAKEDPRLQGIVAGAPLEDGDWARGYLEALIAIDPQRIKGIRRFALDESTAQLADNFVRGVQLLGEYDLSFDLNVGHEDLPLAIQLAERCPNTQIMLNHIGGPDIQGKLRESWWSDIATLAQLPHVACKVSGAVTFADREHWVVADLAPYIERVIEVFGEDRIAYASDWPVMLLGSPYLRWVQALSEITAGLSSAAQRKLWAENARRLYRLAGNDL